MKIHPTLAEVNLSIHETFHSLSSATGDALDLLTSPLLLHSTDFLPTVGTLALAPDSIARSLPRLAHLLHPFDWGLPALHIRYGILNRLSTKNTKRKRDSLVRESLSIPLREWLRRCPHSWRLRRRGGPSLPWTWGHASHPSQGASWRPRSSPAWCGP